MTKIIGNTTATPNPRPDWNQTDPTKANYIENKPEIVDNLDSDSSEAVLSAAQGKVLKQLIEENPSAGITHYWDGTVLTVTSASGTSSADLKGEPGQQGPAGVSPTITVDAWRYFPESPKPGYTLTITDVNGTQEVDIAEGVSTTHSWDGTVLTVTSASGTSSVDLKGEQGPKGDDGYTPVKGVDYYTEEDKEEIVEILDNMQSVAEQDTATMGAELANANNWTLGAGWSGSFANGFTHASGSTEPLTFAPTIESGKLYQVTFKSSVRMTTTNLFVQVGNSTQFNLYAEDSTSETGEISIGVLANDTTGLVFTPEASFTGTLSEISLREITGAYEAIKQYFDTNGAMSFEIHVTPRGLENVFIGQSTGEMNTSGRENVGVGVNVLSKNTSGFWNVGIGKDCLMNNIGGSRNLAIGYNALRDNEVGQRNVALGTFAMTQMKNGNWNIAIGSDSMNEATGGNNNVAVGFNTLTYNVADNNIAIGSHTLTKNTTGTGNVGIGQGAMDSNTTGHYNVCVGYNSGSANTTALGNVGVGWAALYKCTTGQKNIAIGYGAGKSLTTGKNNIIIGAEKEVDATGNYQLNIGDLLKGSLISGAAYLLINGGLRLPNIPTSYVGNDEVYAEEWVFTLEDGTEVTKKVLMK